MKKMPRSEKTFYWAIGTVLMPLLIMALLARLIAETLIGGENDE